MGAYIKGTNGASQGVVPFLKVANDTAVAVNQGGKRNGAVCGYLETWHIDIEEFQELRKNTGDEHRRTHEKQLERIERQLERSTARKDG
jgi:ribonucleoside-diphosphate reductase alpha chain